MLAYRTDNRGRALKALDMADVFGQGWEQQLGQVSATDIDPRLLDTLVPFVRRAVRLRANAISRVPVSLMKGGKDVSARPEWSGLMDGLSSLLYRTEFALSLSPYGAYWRKGANPIGANPTPEWLLPVACWPYLTAEEGLKYIRYVRPFGVPGAGRVEMLPPEEAVRFWYPSLTRANWPGPPPGVTAQPAGSALTSQDSFIAQYFRRGAVKVTLLQIPQGSQVAERDRLTAWWRSFVSGIGNAWRSIVVSTTVTPQVIGDGLKDMNNEALTRQYRQDVAAAFDIPETMLMAGAANYATAISDRISFYEEFVFPELDLLLEAVNAQWLRDAYGCELVSHPEQTEARQASQLEQADKVTALVGQPVFTVDEGRAWLGMDPLPAGAGADAPDADEGADYAAMDAEAAAADQAEDDAELGTAGDAGATAAKGQIMGYHIDGGVVSRNEARAALGLPPEDESADQKLRSLQSSLTVAKLATEAGYSPEQARALVGLPDAGPAPDALKRYARDPGGRYLLLPGATARKAERGGLHTTHAQQRADTRARHQAERRAARERHIAERGTAPDARTRLALVHRQRAELSMLAGRHAAERTVLRSMQAAERARVSDRHAATRHDEIAALRLVGAALPATKAAPATDDPAVRRLAETLRSYLAREYASVAEAIRGYSTIAPDAVDQLPLDDGAALGAILKPFYELIIQHGYTVGAAMVPDVDPFDLQNPYVQEVLDELATRIVGISDTTREEVRALVGRQAVEGWDVATLAALIAQLSELRAPARALTIARTEGANAQTRGALLAWIVSGEVDRVEWLATGESCAACQDLDGQARPIGDTFAPGVFGPPLHPACTCAITPILREVSS